MKVAFIIPWTMFKLFFHIIENHSMIVSQYHEQCSYYSTIAWMLNSPRTTSPFQGSILTFSILSWYHQGVWIWRFGMVRRLSIRNPLLLSEENGWKSSTIWLIIPKWAASALGSLFSQYAGGSGTSGSIWTRWYISMRNACQSSWPSSEREGGLCLTWHHKNALQSSPSHEQPSPPPLP